jgi:flagellar basal-body rod modification protein FlgD
MSTSITGTHQAAASAASATDTSTTPTNTITSEDFMTLLVAEMKNQDPTQPTDPTQYVQQLVGVNSLEQLIGINKGMSELTGSLTTTPTT